MAGENSINTNVGAMVALRNLNKTNDALAKTQDRVSTGLRVIGAKDNASTFAIAQGIRGDIKATQAVQQGLSQGKGIASVAISGATAVSDILVDIKAKIIEGLNPANTSDQQAILSADYVELVGQVLNFVQNAEFNGQNQLISGAAAVAI